MIITRFSRLSTYIILAFASFASAQAQEGSSIITDRPDFTESAVVVPKGVFQFEAGLTHLGITEDFNAQIFGEVLARYGVHRKVELRVELPSYERFSNGTSIGGFGDMAIGGKVQFGPLASGIELGAIAMVSIPSGEDDFSSDSMDPFFIVMASKALSEKTSLAGQVSLDVSKVGDERTTSWGATVVAAHSISGPVSGFAELAFSYDTFFDSWTNFAHGGFTYLANPALQFDVHFGTAISDDGPDYFVGAGFAFRR